MSKNWLTRTLRGADVMSRDGFLSAVPTSPNSVLTQRLPSWKPLCGASGLPWQVFPRICSTGGGDGDGVAGADGGGLGAPGGEASGGGGSLGGGAPGEGSTEEGAEADGSAGEGSTEEGSEADGSTGEGSTEEGSEADGSPGEGSTEEGSEADGSTGDGSTEEGSEADGSDEVPLVFDMSIPAMSVPDVSGVVPVAPAPVVVLVVPVAHPVAPVEPADPVAVPDDGTCPSPQIWRTPWSVITPRFFSQRAPGDSGCDGCFWFTAWPDRAP